MKNHPIADLFPMMAEEELQDLAADIAERGLLQPITRHDGVILDGRNRYAACQIAGVTPQFVDYEGDDPEGYALAVNIARRHMKKGQQAIVAARAKRLFETNNQDQTARIAGVSQSRIACADVILDYAPTLADQILADTRYFDDAYKEAKEARAAAAGDEKLLAKLRESAPDLADQVIEERLTLSEAWTEWLERTADKKLAAQLTKIDEFIMSNGATPFAPRAEDGTLTWQEALTLAEQWRVDYDLSLERDADRVRMVNDGWAALYKILTEPDLPYTRGILAKLAPIDMQRIDEFKQQIRKVCND
jgi:ParB-like chromosome segregation protein Spo0J